MHPAKGIGGAHDELRVAGLPAGRVRGDFERDGHFLEFGLRPDHLAYSFLHAEKGTLRGKREASLNTGTDDPYARRAVVMGGGAGT